MHLLFSVSLLQDVTVDSEGSEEDDSDAASPGKLKVKRGRALLRRSTDEENVPFMTHVVSPEIVKEFMHELKSKWAIFGTSEVGVAARGALALKHPVVLFANNAKQEEILREGLEAGIVKSCLTGGDFSSKTLTAAWQAAQGSSDSDSESGSDDKTSEQSDDKAEDNKENKDKKEKKEKDKKDKKGKDKKEKKDKKNKKEKAKKGKDKKEKAKKDKKGQHGEKAASSTGGADVLKALIAKGSGAQG